MSEKVDVHDRLKACFGFARGLNEFNLRQVIINESIPNKN